MTLLLTDPDVRDAINALEIEKGIKPIQKALILMVADGKKPATWQQIASEKWTEGSEETRLRFLINYTLSIFVSHHESR